MFNLDSLIKITTNGSETMHNCGVTKGQAYIIIGVMIIAVLIFDICMTIRYSK